MNIDKESKQNNETNQEGTNKKKVVEPSKNIMPEKKKSYLESIYESCYCNGNFFDKKLLTGCLISSVVSIAGVFIVLKLSMDSHESRIQQVIDNNKLIEDRLKSVGSSVSDLDNSIKSIKSELESGHENSAYIYTSIASMQKDLSAIKKQFHMDDDKDSAVSPESAQKLSADQISFINSFETLVLDGAPFDSFLKSYEEKIDISKYAVGKELLEFSSTKTKSVSELQKDFEVIGQSEFGMTHSETFWEKQKRIIKEKLSDAIKIKKAEDAKENPTDKIDEKELDDKTLYSMAAEFLADDNLKDAVEVLEKMKIENSDLSGFIKNAKTRVKLNELFQKFKNEFLESPQ